MIGLAIRFELGRYHANPWGMHVNDAATEWPPSPWRLIRALFAVTRTNVSLSSQQAAIDRALQSLANAPPPVFELPPIAAGHTRHYMPRSSYSAASPGETAKVIDGFVALDPSSELRAWWDLALDAEETDGLAAAARSLGYLGRSESVCSARLITGAGPKDIAAAPIDSTSSAHGETELVDLLCPRPGPEALTALTVSVTELRKQHRLLPPGTRSVTYAVSKPSSLMAPSGTRTMSTRPTLALLRLHGSQRPAITDAVAVAQSLRSALQHWYGRGHQNASSPTFSGRAGDTPRADQHLHAHYFAAPDTHGRRIDKLFVWAPEGFGQGEIRALAELSYLTLRDAPQPIACTLGALGSHVEMKFPELLGPARTWHSLTPFGLVRHPKMRRGTPVDSPEDQVRSELEHRGLPLPEEIFLEKGSWHRFRSSKVGTSRLQQASLFGVRLSFAEEVPGPIALGALSHFGLGLFVTSDD